jgi:hypothetical protein
MKHTKIVLLTFLFLGCSRSAVKPIPFSQQEIQGRDEVISWKSTVRRPVYQAKVPLAWQRIDPAQNESLLDTTHPIVSFVIEDGVIVYVHSFPANSLEERIPPAAQIERWRQQLKPTVHTIEPAAHGGFAGLFFEGKNDAHSLLAWSLQLGLEHFQTLHFLAGTVEEEEHYRQMAADVTIKVSGPTPLIKKHYEEIVLFASSFELIQEIPER